MRASIFALLIILALFPQSHLYAAEGNISLKDVAELEDKQAALSAKPDYQKIQAKGATPLSAMLLISKAAQKRDWESAAQHIDTRFLPKNIAEIGGPELIRRLSIVWNQQNIVDISSLSTEETGHLDDGLPSYRDLLGILETSNGEVPVYIQRVPVKDGNRVWKISNSTLAAIPDLWRDFGRPESIERIAQFLPQFSLLEMENWQVIILVIIAIGSWAVFKFLSWAIGLTCQGKLYGPALKRFFSGGLRLFLIFSTISISTGLIGLSIKAKVLFSSGLLDYIAFFYLFMGLIQLSTSIYVLRQNSNPFTVAILKPLSTALKIFFTIAIFLSWLSSAGYNIGTIIAGLGIGSLAIALAAQKTLENIFGALTMYISRPISPGDFCKFGDTLGTVEEIGLRATRIRKLDRTVVHIPNSEFASKKLENFAETDRRHYQQRLRLRLDTTPDNIRQLLIALKELLLSHGKVLPDDRRVRFQDIEDDAFVICVNAYVSVRTILEYKAIEEDLNLHLIEILEQHSVKLATPQQHVSIERVLRENHDPADQAKSEIEALKKAKKLPLPNFSPEDIREMRNTIPYPPEGSVES